MLPKNLNQQEVFLFTQVTSQIQFRPAIWTVRWVWYRNLYENSFISQRFVIQNYTPKSSGMFLSCKNESDMQNKDS